MDHLELQTPSAWGLSVGTVAAYLALYTAYDKASKKLVASSLLDVLAFRKGLDHSLVQWNKVISLAGITTLSVALAPYGDMLVTDQHELLLVSTGMLTVHSLYSTYRYYGSPNIPYVSNFTKFFKNARSTIPKEIVEYKRMLSLMCGLAATNLVDAYALGYLDQTHWGCLWTLSLATLHFFYMEQDFRGKLAVRPFGFLGFVAPIAAGCATIWKMWQ